MVPGDDAFVTTNQRRHLEGWIDSVQPGLASDPPFLAVWAASAPHSPYSRSPLTLLSTSSTVACQDSSGLVHSSDRMLWIRYQTLLESLDTEVGNLRAALEAKPGRLGGASSTWDETVVLVLGDNGTPTNLSAEDALQCDGDPANSVNRIHPYVETDPDDFGRFKGSPFLTGTSVPLIVSGYQVDGGSCVGASLPGRVDDDSVLEIVDVFATILDLAGVPAPSGVTIDGNSFAPLLTATGSVAFDPLALSMRYSPNGDLRCAVVVSAGLTARLQRSGTPTTVSLSATGNEVYRLVRITNFLPSAANPACTTDKLYRVRDYTAPDAAEVREEIDLLNPPAGITLPIPAGDVPLVQSLMTSLYEQATLVGHAPCSCSALAPGACTCPVVPGCPPPNAHNAGSQPCPTHSSL